MKIKQCPRCKRWLAREDFNKNKSSLDGLQDRCRQCTKEVDHEYYRDNPGRRQQIREGSSRIRARNRQFVQGYLREHPCVDCGESDLVVLDFDHVRGKKDGCIANGVRQGWSIKRLQREIEKCEVRCANCHRRRHAREGSWC